MPKLPAALAVLPLVAVSAAFAHAHLVSSSPANDSTLATAPRALVLEFSEAASLTVLAIAGPGGAQQKLAPLPPDPARRVSVALPPLTPGEYVVTWRALGVDGHLTSGKIRFHLPQ